MDVAERFWVKVGKTLDGCWEWTACRSGDGYGRFMLDGKVRRSHRVAYELVVGAIPVGLQLDHLCRNRACVNPAHLEPVTSAENSRRGISPQLARERAKCVTHCPRGHPYDAANTYLSKVGRRACKACRALKMREYRLMLNESVREPNNG